MPEYYFDIETTGTDFDKDEIITIQWQRLSGYIGEPLGELNILKRWELSEKEMLQQFKPYLTCNPWEFIFVGKNLFFDFCMLNERLKHFGLGEIDLRFLNQRVSLDIKPILVVMNGGSFKGYDKLIPKTNPTTNDMIPQCYKDGECDKIIQYIEAEAKDFIAAYQILKKELPQLKQLFQ